MGWPGGDGGGLEMGGAETWLGLSVKDPASQESLKDLKPLTCVSSLLEVLEASGPRANGEDDRHWAGRAQESSEGPSLRLKPRTKPPLDTPQGSTSPLSSAMLASLMVCGLRRRGEGRDSLTEKPNCFRGAPTTCTEMLGCLTEHFVGARPETGRKRRHWLAVSPCPHP